MSGTQRVQIVDATFFDEEELSSSTSSRIESEPDWPKPKLQSSYAHLNKAVDSGQITARAGEDFSFLGLPSHPDEEDVAPTPSPSLPHIPSLASIPSFSGDMYNNGPGSPTANPSVTLVGLTNHTPRSRAKSRILSHPPPLKHTKTMSQKMNERSGLVNIVTDEDSLTIYCRLGRLQDFDHRISAHHDILEITISSQDIVATIVDNFKEEHPELIHENLVVFHNFRKIPNIAQTLENAHVKDGDIVELVSFNPNAVEWLGVKKSMISSLLFGFGIALFFLGFTFYETTLRGLIVMAGFLFWFFSGIACCMGTAESNVFNANYHPTQAQTWNIPVLN